MQLWTTRGAREAPFDCRWWSTREPRATRGDIDRGYAHAVHRVALDTSFGDAVERLLAYEIFPRQRMHAHICTASGRVELGATIIQRISLWLAVVETAVRVVELEQAPDRVRYTYATLAGHVERGLASFAVTRARADVTLHIETWSQPGHWLTTVARPFARGVQRRFTEEALAALKAGV